MGKSLVIVESPAKAKTINKFLGRGFTVKASMGHVRDLPKRTLGVDEKKNFKPTYEVLPGRKKVLDDLKKAQPTLVAVSAGFDAYARDPIAQETLEAEDFHWLGQSIRRLGIPAFSILEGGYSRDLPELILAYLKGWSGA